MEKLRQGVRFVAAIDRRRLRRDLLSALTVAAVAVPQDMAYAQIAGIPPQYGLYTGFVVTALAALFGSSAHLISGPTNAISLVVFSALATLNFGPDQANQGLGMMKAVWLLAFMVGAIQLLIALLRLGDLTRYVSESVLLGFMAGAGVLIVLGQIPNLLGIKPLGDGHLSVLQRLWLT
ncbi:MAG TPA: SulP family inorganic anion transporter, partial [Gemmataceae bacterium]|nr:SulP family inorganic anion transporter [Gemmataceae bacterium]